MTERRNGGTPQQWADDTRTALAGLNVQVKGIERDYTDLRTAVGSLEIKLDSGLNAVANQLSAAINSLNAKLDERNRPQWQALGVMLTAFIAFVGFAYWPIHNSQEDNRLKIDNITASLPEHYVNYREHERLMKAVDVDIDSLRKQMVSRDEHVQHWTGIRDREDAIQKQIDTIKADFGGVFTARDQLIRLQKDLDDIHSLILRGGGSK